MVYWIRHLPPGQKTPVEGRANYHTLTSDLHMHLHMDTHKSTTVNNNKNQDGEGPKKDIELWLIGL